MLSNKSGWEQAHAFSLSYAWTGRLAWGKKVYHNLWCKCFQAFNPHENPVEQAWWRLLLYFYKIKYWISPTLYNQENSQNYLLRWNFSHFIVLLDYSKINFYEANNLKLFL